MARREPAAARSCSRLSRPLAEQRATLSEAGRTRPESGFRPRRSRRAGSSARAVTCAAMSTSVRRAAMAPRPIARRARSSPMAASRGPPPSCAPSSARAAISSGAMASRLNGKPLENTYEEWRKSPAARRGLQCQNCHMPDRRHLWRGIHDRRWCSRASPSTLRADRPRYRAGDLLRATADIASRVSATTSRPM